jgi:hypothetical protein
VEPPTDRQNTAAGSARGVAWTLCALALLVTAAVVALAGLNGQFGDLSFSIVGLTSAAVGGVVASRRPENVIGWLFLAGALLSGLRALGGQYAIYGSITAPGSLPAPEAAAWFSNAIQFLGPVVIFILIPFYFPNGRPVTPRWRIVPLAAVGALPLATLLAAFTPGEVLDGAGIQNPFGYEVLRPVNDVLGPILFAWYIGLIFVSALSLVVRFRRARGEERQQIKWFTYAAAFIPVWFMTNRPVEEAFPMLFNLLDALVIAAVPVAAGIAVLRYRLYDIDLIINRTLVYAALTAALVGIYFGSVILLQYALRTLTGGDSQLVVVASTLAIAALFNPLRRGIQAFIDRRFYRQKYDARETLEAFSSRLRGETDLEALGDGLVAVARKTMRPEHASLLLLPPARAPRGWDR